jgi:hypothetical protein
MELLQVPAQTRPILRSDLHDQNFPQPSYVSGLFMLSPPTASPNNTYSEAIDVVAIHGFNGHASNTGKSPQCSLWLRDLLLRDTTNARALSFGYDTDALYSGGMSGIQRLLRPYWMRYGVLWQFSFTPSLDIHVPHHGKFTWKRGMQRRRHLV